MTAQVLVAKETAAGELRVAATPETVKKYVKDGLTVVVEAGAGSGANIADQVFVEAGATIAPDARTPSKDSSGRFASASGRGSLRPWESWKRSV